MSALHLPDAVLWVGNLRWLIPIFIAVSVTYLVFGMDDLFVDAVAWLKGLAPDELTGRDWDVMNEIPEKKIAVIVAAWKEGDIISSMVRGNMERLSYSRYDFILGVYPNDEQTLSEALALQREFPSVKVVVNRLPGPTSKGQMLNEVVRNLTALEGGGRDRYDVILMQDAEDIIHPFALKLVNWQTELADFVQIPVFSLPLPGEQLIAGTYMDEFAESHTKDILVRQHLGAPVPSAGVGTAMTRRFVEIFRAHQSGDLFNPKTVTEDYQLGVSSHQYGLRTRFACYYYWNGDQKEFIATREYFPKKFGGSVRQKSRWVLGISFQGAAALGWKGAWAHKYFLFRDRKGPVANTLTLVGLFLFMMIGAENILEPTRVTVFFPWREMADDLIVVNFLLMANRLFQRFYSTRKVHGTVSASLVIPRMILGNVINALASLRATYQYAKYLLAGVTPAWLKTEHQLPRGFGSSPTGPRKAQVKS